MATILWSIIEHCRPLKPSKSYECICFVYITLSKTCNYLTNDDKVTTCMSANTLIRAKLTTQGECS
jgi:hypothetical protein